MTATELENYILSKPNAIKKTIPEWKYARYTVFSLMFVSIGETKHGIGMTLFGRFPKYEEDYAGIIVPAVDNEPLHFSSVLLTKGALPDYVLKSMIDFSYKERLKAVLMPRSALGDNGDIPYCGIDFRIMDNKSGKRADKETASTEDVANAVRSETLHACDEMGDCEVITDIGNPNIPYSIVEDEDLFKAYKKYAKLLKKTKHNV